MSLIATTSKPQPRLTTTSSPPTTYSHLLYVNATKRESVMASNIPSSCASSSSSSTHSVPSTRSAASSHTNPSIHSLVPTPKFADDHYPLITTLNLNTRLPHKVSHKHPAVWSAHHMAQIHNIIIRALNSSYNQCLSVQPSTTAAKDFLFFNATIATTLHHHHLTEDTFLFSELEKLMNQPGTLHENTEQHESFMDGLMVYTKYVTSTSAVEYNGLTLRHMIESFAPKLIEHLHDEITSLLSTHVVKDEAALLAVWKQAAAMAQKDNDLYVVGPFFLGCQDKEFRIDGMEGDFPRVPWVLEKVVQTWHARRYAGAWRFLPSDLNGKRRLLQRV